MDSRRHFDIISGKDRSFAAGGARLSFDVMETFYALGVRARNKAFDWGWQKTFALGRPTVSVGNLTTGGTGKTPHVLEVVRRLQTLGARPAVLLRGYVPRHADSDAALLDDDNRSDETKLLQEALGPDVSVQANPNRVQGAQQVLAAHPQMTVLVLDDGFQHRRARRDLDLVLIDATEPFGLGRLLPAGLLREPISGLRRAQAVIITRSDLVPPERLAAIRKRVELAAAGKELAVIHTAMRWAGLLDAQGATHPMEELYHAPVAAVCGIGNPRQFKTMLGRHFEKVVGQYEMEDHQAYTPALVREIMGHAGKQGAAALLMTEKDWVKWQGAAQDAAATIPVYRLVLELAVTQGEETFMNLLRKVVDQTTGSAGIGATGS